MLEIVVCCGDTNIRKWLGDVIGEYGFLCHESINVSMFADGRILLSRMENGYRFQIIILDIMMNMESTGPPGPELPGKIRSYDKNCVIIFIAESVDFAFWCYSVHAFDYLLIPLDKRKVVKAITEAIGFLLGHDQAILPVKAKGINTPVKHTNILYIESVGHHLRIHLTNDSIYQVYGKLDDYVYRLKSGPSFLRCHKSFLVNMDHVEGISGRDFIMMNGSRVPIRKASAAKLKNEYYQYIQKNRA